MRSIFHESGFQIAADRTLPVQRRRLHDHCGAACRLACHCTECQRQSGSAFSLSLPVDRSAVVVEEGQPAVWERQHESGRVIDCVTCAKCGSRLFHEPRANTKITIVKAGNLDDTSWLFPVGHIWTRSAQPWVAIPPDGANCDGQPPNFGNIMEAWRRFFMGAHRR
jgi:hypothetical protein